MRIMITSIIPFLYRFVIFLKILIIFVSLFLFSQNFPITYIKEVIKMDDKDLEKLVRSIPEEIIQDVLAYIDELCTRYNQESQDKALQEDS